MTNNYYSNLTSYMKLLILVFALVYIFFCSMLSYAFESELCPIELNHIFANQTTSIALHKDPSNKSPIVKRISIKNKEEILIDQSRTRTIKSGKVKVKKNVYLEGKSFGDLSYLSDKKYDAALPMGEIKLQKYLFKKGDIIEELHHAPEGTCIIRWKKNVIWIDGCLWYGDAVNFDYISKPDYEWWIRVTRDNKPLGWILIEEKTPVDLY